MADLDEKEFSRKADEPANLNIGLMVDLPESRLDLDLDLDKNVSNANKSNVSESVTVNSGSGSNIVSVGYNNSNISQGQNTVIKNRDVEGEDVEAQKHVESEKSAICPPAKFPGCDSQCHTNDLVKIKEACGHQILFESDIKLNKMSAGGRSRPRSNNDTTYPESDKEETLRFSDLSLSSDDEEDDIKFKSLEQLKRQVDFLMYSSTSSISDDQDSASRLELMENLSDQSVLSSDDTELYNDWDPGLSKFISETSQGNRNPEVYDSESEIERIPEQDLPFPHRAQHIMECEICLKMSYLRRRVCCDYQICNKCLATYITLKVKEGKVKMECPNDRCDVLIFKDEIHYRLSTNMREKFTKFLIDANADPYIKTCPSCSLAYQIDPEILNVGKKKLKYGLKVVCSHCKLVWCYPCQAPFHTNLTCKKYKKDDEMVKRWAKEKNEGQANAQKCPKCKVIISDSGKEYHCREHIKLFVKFTVSVRAIVSKPIRPQTPSKVKCAPDFGCLPQI